MEPRRLSCRRVLISPGVLSISVAVLEWNTASPAWTLGVGYDSPAMLSRAQEARVRAILWSSPAGTVQTYCPGTAAAEVR